MSGALVEKKVDFSIQIRLSQPKTIVNGWRCTKNIQIHGGRDFERLLKDDTSSFCFGSPYLSLERA